jgi:hypothetical protein
MLLLLLWCHWYLLLLQQQCWLLQCQHCCILPWLQVLASRVLL